MMDRELTWGGEPTIQCTDDVLWNCAPETCMILLTCHLDKVDKKERKSRYTPAVKYPIILKCSAPT